MRVLAYPELDANIAQQGVFVAYLKGMERKSITQDVREDEGVSFLCKWWLNHILVDEKNYAAHFAQTGQSKD